MGDLRVKLAGTGVVARWAPPALICSCWSGLGPGWLWPALYSVGAWASEAAALIGEGGVAGGWGACWCCGLLSLAAGAARGRRLVLVVWR